MPLSLRYATEKDALLIADLSRQTFYESFAAQNTKENMDIFLGLQFTKGRLMMEVGRKGNTFLLAEADDAVVGYAKLTDAKRPPQIQSNNALEIARLYVVQSKIGSGVGGFLMRSILQIAANEKKDTVWLGVWKENERAIKFYEKWGFEKFDEWEFLLGNDLQKDWLMKKKIEPGFLS